MSSDKSRLRPVSTDRREQALTMGTPNVITEMYEAHASEMSELLSLVNEALTNNDWRRASFIYADMSALCDLHIARYREVMLTDAVDRTEVAKRKYDQVAESYAAMAS